MRWAEHTVSDTSNISLIPALKRLAFLVAHRCILSGRDRSVKAKVRLSGQAEGRTKWSH